MIDESAADPATASMFGTPQLLVDDRLAALVYAAGVYATAWVVALLFVQAGRPRALVSHTKGRVGSLDGLRGVLALGVVVHHSVIAWVDSVSGVWALLPNTLLNQLGQTSVALFFMITGFLFTRQSMRPRIDWLRFYTNRLARLGPPYFVVVCVVFVIVLAATGEARETPATLLKEWVRWMSFDLLHTPDINGFPNSWKIIAGVNWSLAYEVLFYLIGVPALFWLHRRLPVRTACACLVVGLSALLIYRVRVGEPASHSLYVAQFLGGAICACLYANTRTRGWLASETVRVVASLGVIAISFMPRSSGAAAVILTTITFAAAVGNASVFGLLKNRAALWLGEISYGVYLVHGTVLWIGFRALRHALDPGAMPLALFFAFIALVVLTTVCIASISHLYLELPVMAYIRRFTSNTRPMPAVEEA